MRGLVERWTCADISARLTAARFGFTEVLAIDRVLDTPQARHGNKLAQFDVQDFTFDPPDCCSRRMARSRRTCRRCWASIPWPFWARWVSVMTNVVPRSIPAPPGCRRPACRSGHPYGFPQHNCDDNRLPATQGVAMVNERSLLFVPGDHPERFGKALGAGADRVVIDLEDAVLPEAKDGARDHIANRLSQDGSAEIAIRINGTNTGWSSDDLALAVSSPRVAAIMLPKAERKATVEAIATRLRRGQRVIALVETAAPSIASILRGREASAGSPLTRSISARRQESARWVTSSTASGWSW